MQSGSSFVKGILTGVIAGAAVGIAADSMKNTKTGHAVKKNVDKAVKSVGSVVDNFTHKMW